MYKSAIIAGATLAAIAVIIGAFGAHALKAAVTAEKLAVFETGVRYHFYHSAALLICGIIHAGYPSKLLRTATLFFILGIACFSGSLYAITLVSIEGGSIGPAGIITPIGGVFFIVAWVLLLVGVAGYKQAHQNGSKQS